MNQTEVVFVAEFQGNPHTFHLTTATEELASKIHAAISENIGKSMAELGEVEIEQPLKH